MSSPLGGGHMFPLPWREGDMCFPSLVEGIHVCSPGGRVIQGKLRGHREALRCLSWREGHTRFPSLDGVYTFPLPWREGIKGRGSTGCGAVYQGVA